MDGAELRELVRNVLREELGRSNTAATTATATPRVERVTLRSDNELMAFVHRIVQLAGDDRQRADIESGRRAFSLAQSKAAPAPAARGDTPSFVNGLVTERHIEALDDGIAQMEVAASVRFTPLALDRLRQRGIKVKRKKS